MTGSSGLRPNRLQLTRWDANILDRSHWICVGLPETDHLATDVTSGQAFACRDGETLLSAAVRSGNQIIRVGCRAGGCGMCKIRILNGNFSVGKMSRAHVSEAEERHGYVLACRTVPTGTIEFCSRIDSGLPEDGDKGVKV